MTTPRPHADDHAQEQEAWRWLLQRHAAEPGSDERAFQRWLAADPRHPQLYARAEAVWMRNRANTRLCHRRFHREFRCMDAT